MFGLVTDLPPLGVGVRGVPLEAVFQSLEDTVESEPTIRAAVDGKRAEERERVRRAFARRGVVQGCEIEDGHGREREGSAESCVGRLWVIRPCQVDRLICRARRGCRHVFHRWAMRW
jgi:hypothetical protein